MPAVARIISKYKENLDRPERELCDAEDEPVVSSSGDSTLNNSDDVVDTVPENNVSEIEENKRNRLVSYPSDSDSDNE